MTFNYLQKGCFVLSLSDSATLIKQALDKNPTDIEAAEYLFESIIALEKQNYKYSHDLNRYLKFISANALSKTKDLNHIQRFYEIQRKCLIFSAKRGDFDSFLQAVEWNRPIDKKFYLPRRRYLKQVVDGYQAVVDKKIRLLLVSLVKRGGKSQLEINFVNMLSGMFPNKSTLMEGTGDDLVKSFYRGCLEYLEVPSDYSFYDIFPDSKLVQTSADVKTINLHTKSRFPTIMCRSIDSRQVGLSEATNVLCLDDCVEGYMESKNRDRLEEKWRVISGDVIGRAIEGTPIVANGTRYSIHDPMGKLEEEAIKQNWEYRKISIPALDPVTQESNYEFELAGNKIFTTKYFKEQKITLSEEQFESEFQQEPFESKGLMFPRDSLNRYFKLPVDYDPDAVIAVCDTAEGGEDSVMLPVAYIYGPDVFIEDVIFDNSPPQYTKPRCAKILVQHAVSTAMFESNNAGSYYARDVETLMKDLGGKTSILTKRTISNKHTRIENASDGILKYFWFKDQTLYEENSDYGRMIKELTAYTRTGKSKHDDAPDGLSLLENQIRLLSGSKIGIMKRPI